MKLTLWWEPQLFNKLNFLIFLNQIIFSKFIKSLIALTIIIQSLFIVLDSVNFIFLGFISTRQQEVFFTQNKFFLLFQNLKIRINSKQILRIEACIVHLRIFLWVTYTIKVFLLTKFMLLNAFIFKFLNDLNIIFNNKVLTEIGWRPKDKLAIRCCIEGLRISLIFNLVDIIQLIDFTKEISALVFLLQYLNGFAYMTWINQSLWK